jgi:hypothetical protein
MKRVAFYCSTLALAAGLLAFPAVFADGGANHQVRNLKFGVSGGNINDISRAFCCSGTLGALVQANGVNYILSNNHVLARGDQAAAGEDISQPGLIDNGCQPATIVADFTAAPPLGSNVDAAVAQLRTGLMLATGEIEDTGVISNAAGTPTVGLAVAKSGRTTGFTTGNISSINTSVSVQYQKGCNQGRKFTVSYTNQVVINSSTFSAGGDSGSLIVSNTNANCRQAVALLYAGSSTTTIGNPIGEVLTKLGTALGGGTVSFVGKTCSASSPNELVSDDPQFSAPVSEAVEKAVKAMKTREIDLITRPGVIGVGVGASDSIDQASIVVYIDSTSNVRTKLPKTIKGVKVVRVYTEPFVAY